MHSDTLAHIGKASIFAQIGVAEASDLAEILEDNVFPAGHTLFSEGETGDRFYVIVDGQVEIGKTLDGGQDRILAVRGPGEFFGEMSLLDPDGVRTATARTQSPVRLLSLKRADFDRLLHKRPDLALEIMRVLSHRLRDSQDATINDLRAKNEELRQAYSDLKAAQAQLLEKARLEQELRTAQRIQQSILPTGLPHLPGYDFGARFIPARAVGGDLYDFIALGKGKLGVAVGDVSDKGMPAAIFMALTRSLLRAEATRTLWPRLVLERVNHLLLDMNNEGMFVTLLYGVLDSERHTFAYARAGHELPLLLEADGSTRLMAAGRGAPLGLFSNVTIDEQVIPLYRDSALLLYTDGATDMTDSDLNLFGIDQLQTTVRSAEPGCTAQHLCDEVWRGLAGHCGASIQADDVALVAIRATWKTGEEAR